MLTAAERELIAAAVDGDLTPDQDAAFHRLLASSMEAGSLFQAIEADACRLRSMPRVATPTDLSRRVMARIAPVPVTTSVAHGRSAPPARRRASRIPYAVALSALFAMAAWSYWFAVREAERPTDVAHRASLPVNGAGDRPTYSAVVSAPLIRDTLPSPRTVTEADTGALRAEVPARSVVESAPLPRPHGVGSVLAAGPLNDLRPFETVLLRLPFMASVAELDRPAVRTKLLTELGGDTAFRLDLFTRDANRAAELVQAAATSVGMTIIVDAGAADRMRRKVPTAWAVYTEALPPVDVVALLGHLAKSTRADAATPFGTAHLIPAQQAEHRDVRDLLGTDPGPWKRTRPVDSMKPISADTAEKVTSALTRSSVAWDRSAIMLPYLPPHARANPELSRGVKAYLDQRANRPHDAVPLLIVIRPAE